MILFGEGMMFIAEKRPLISQGFGSARQHLKLSRPFGRTKDAQLLGLEGIHDSGDQRSLGTDDGKLDGILLGETD